MAADPLPDISGRPPAPTRTERARAAALVVGGMVLVLWALQVVDSLTGYALVHDGIRPRQLASLPDVLVAPFIHVSWGHLIGNTVPLFVLGFLVALGGIRRLVAVSALIVVVSGLGVWLVGPADSVTVGASGVVFGYFGYLVARGVLDRRPVDLVVGLVVGALYWTMLGGLLPEHRGVSWPGHLFGLIGGVLGAWLWRAPDQPVTGGA